MTPYSNFNANSQVMYKEFCLSAVWDYLVFAQSAYRCYLIRKRVTVFQVNGPRMQQCYESISFLFSHQDFYDSEISPPHPDSDRFFFVFKIFYYFLLSLIFNVLSISAGEQHFFFFPFTEEMLMPCSFFVSLWHNFSQSGASTLPPWTRVTVDSVWEDLRAWSWNSWH